ncbi:unnamed protein product [Rotaria sp. Silwood1]|nr:unnamed protein product [Rotaria sp. Silwood1]
MFTESTGDAASWQWICNVNNWNGMDWKHYCDDKYYELFKRRDGATCSSFFLDPHPDLRSNRRLDLRRHLDRFIYTFRLIDRLLARRLDHCFCDHRAVDPTGKR